MNGALLSPHPADGASIAHDTSLSRSRVAAAICLAAVAIAVTYKAWADTLAWALNDAESGQILLTPIAFVWLLWARRRIPGRPANTIHGEWFVGPALVAVGWVAWAAGFYRGHDLLWHGGALLMVVGGALSILGSRTLLKFWPAFLALSFAVPVTGIGRQFVSGPLQVISARITQELCEVLGMNVGRFGNVLQINGREVAIAEACNGLRMIWPLFAITYLFAFITLIRPWARALVLVASPLVAIAANVARLAPTVWVYGHCSENAASVFHEAAGWVMLILAFLVLVGIARLLRGSLPAAGSTAPAQAADRDSSSADPSRERDGMIIATMATALLLTGAAWTAWAMPVEADASGYYLAVKQSGQQTPLEIGNWMGRDIAPADGTEELLTPNLVISREYVNRVTGNKANVLIVQVKDARALQWHSATICYPARGWELVSRAGHEWAAAGLKLPGTEYEFYRGGFPHSADIIVADMLLLPDGTIAADIGPVNERAQKATERFFGAAHLQIVCDATIAVQDRQQMIQELLAGYVPLIHAIGLVSR